MILRGALWVFVYFCIIREIKELAKQMENVSRIVSSTF